MTGVLPRALTSPDPPFRQATHYSKQMGMKTANSLTPCARGGNIGLFGGTGVSETASIQELII